MGFLHYNFPPVSFNAVLEVVSLPWHTARPGEKDTTRIEDLLGMNTNCCTPFILHTFQSISLQIKL